MFKTKIVKREDLIEVNGALYYPMPIGLFVDLAKKFKEAEITYGSCWAASNWNKVHTDSTIKLSFKNGPHFELHTCVYAGMFLVGKVFKNSNLIVISAADGAARNIPNTEHLFPKESKHRNSHGRDLCEVEGPNGIGVVNLDLSSVVVPAEFEKLTFHSDGKIFAYPKDKSKNHEVFSSRGNQPEDYEPTAP